MADKGSLIFDQDLPVLLGAMGASSVQSPDSSPPVDFDAAQSLSGQNFSGPTVAAAVAASSVCVGESCPLLRFCTRSARLLPVDPKEVNA